MKTYRSLFVAIALVVFVVPQVALAAWWNPFSWNVWHIFSSIPKVQTEKIVNATSTPKTAATAEVSETQKLNTTGQSTKDTGNAQSSAPTKNSATQAVEQLKTSKSAIATATQDYRPQILNILNTAKENLAKLLHYSEECASMVSKRETQVEQLMTPGRAVTLPKVAFDSYLTKSYKLFYDMGDNEIAAMESYRIYCEKTIQDSINNNISKINSDITAFQTLNKSLTSDDLVAYQIKYFGSNYTEDTRANVKNVIDRASKFITTNNSGYTQILEAMDNYVSDASTPIAPPVQYVPVAPLLPQLPQTTRCTISGDGGVGLQAYVSCSTSSF